ncbi:hypothetical protein [Aliiroseovarius sp. PrR006]|uniref:hypothetical protein n=1 Tax=Aliiroseovarius sp. PrR006 TaxID=2706883 RepID=UPI0013D660A3|nr:hypothetical protein [Aliiroseovarius sp. PrR006]NDW54299.1 hypothetical protein [Aliiroseovarius sp. PrR006]
MTKEDDKVFSRRKALTRIGGLALAAYSVPALTTLSAAHASSAPSAASAASEASDPSPASDPSEASEPSEASVPSESSGPSGPRVVTAEECEAGGGTVVEREDGVKVCES